MTIIEQLLKEVRQTKRETDKLMKIDEAAVMLFAEKGFANTSTKDIASKAGVAEGTIFKHFKTKDDLLKYLLLKFMNEVLHAGVGFQLSSEEVRNICNCLAN